MARKNLYKVSFYNQGKLYELFARRVSHGELFGFLEVAELVFGKKSAVIVDPNENALRAEFENSEKIFISLHSVVRIDQLGNQSQLKPRVVSLKTPEAPVEEATEKRFTPIYTPPNPFTRG